MLFVRSVCENSHILTLLPILPFKHGTENTIVLQNLQRRQYLSLP